MAHQAAFVRKFRGQSVNAPMQDWDSEFIDWMDNSLKEKRRGSVEFGVIAMDDYLIRPTESAEEDAGHGQQSAEKPKRFHFLPKVFFTRS